MLGADFEFLNPNPFAFQGMTSHKTSGVDKPDMLAIGHWCWRGRVCEGAVDLVGPSTRQVATPENLPCNGRQAMALAFRNPGSLRAVVLSLERSKASQKKLIAPHRNAAVTGFW